MNKILTLSRLAPVALGITFVCLLLSGVSGCGPHDGRPSINDDTLRNHVIPISLAVQYTKAFRSTLDSNYHLRPRFSDSLKFSRAEEYPADIFYDLLAQSDPKQGKAKGIRIYFGRDSSGQLKLVLVPVDSLGNDMIKHLVDQKGKQVPGTAHVEALTVSDGQGFEIGQLCPPTCSSSSPLNP